MKLVDLIIYRLCPIGTLGLFSLLVGGAPVFPQEAPRPTTNCEFNLIEYTPVIADNGIAWDVNDKHITGVHCRTDGLKGNLYVLAVDGFPSTSSVHGLNMLIHWMNDNVGKGHRYIEGKLASR